MIISIRLSDNWEYKIENKSKTHCDRCGAKLWIAPHGAKYCDKVHEKTASAVTLGKLGGSKKSDKKTDASRENGKKGGRPVVIDRGLFVVKVMKNGLGEYGVWYGVRETPNEEVKATKLAYMHFFKTQEVAKQWAEKFIEKSNN